MYGQSSPGFFLQKQTIMRKKTLKELRAAARTRGLRGYSKLPRTELEKLLSRSGPSANAVPEKPGKENPKKAAASGKSGATIRRMKSTIPARVKNASAVPPAKTATPAEKAPAAPKWKWADVRSPEEEERVERAKFATNPAGQSSPAATDLNEDIDKLPPLTEPMLCLLPQKPGVMHGYWVAPPGTAPSAQSLKLRFGRIANDVFEILEEIPLSRERGHWYFRVDESADIGAVYLQLGYYETDGRFVNAIRRGIARVPSLYASEKTDRLWWVSEEQFQTMYRRAGGKISGPRPGWTASIGSPGGAPSGRR